MGIVLLQVQDRQEFLRLAPGHPPRAAVPAPADSRQLAAALGQEGAVPGPGQVVRVRHHRAQAGQVEHREVAGAGCLPTVRVGGSDRRSGPGRGTWAGPAGRPTGRTGPRGSPAAVCRHASAGGSWSWAACQSHAPGIRYRRGGRQAGCTGSRSSCPCCLHKRKSNHNKTTAGGGIHDILEIYGCSHDGGMGLHSQLHVTPDVKLHGHGESLNVNPGLTAE